MDQLASEISPPKRRRRFTPAFKAMVVAASNEPEQSVASVVLQYQLNANLLHKWRRQQTTHEPADFIRLPAPANTVAAGNPREIDTVQIDLPGGITLHWPVDQIDRSVAWLKAMNP